MWILFLYLQPNFVVLLKSFIMNKQIKIRLFDFLSDGKQKTVYQNSVSVNENLDFDFLAVEKTLRILYPSARFVEFTLS